MTDNMFNLKHDYFESLAPEIIRSIGMTEMFSDVVLVSSQGEGIKGHKIILSSFSEVLGKILKDKSLTTKISFYCPPPALQLAIRLTNRFFFCVLLRSTCVHYIATSNAGL